jgi:hypothetical protein
MKLAKEFLRTLSRNTRLRLKEGVYKSLKNRVWLFHRLENETIYLLDETGMFGIGVKVESIDWGKE